MSLFENEEYQWRETYFVLFESARRPTAAAMRKALAALEGNYRLEDLRETDDGRFESVTLYSPDDYAAMDITYVSGQDVQEQTAELVQDMRRSAAGREVDPRIARLRQCDARFDIYHFEQIVFDAAEDEEEFLDPGSLFSVIERLVHLCDGLGVDPQTGSLLV